VIPDAEAIVGRYLREDPNILALDARVVGRTPRSTTGPWIRLTQLDARAISGTEADHLIDFYLQLDGFAGTEGDQELASRLVRSARSSLRGMRGEVEDVVVTDVRFGVFSHVPDRSFTPEVERYVLDAFVYIHPVESGS
jgi:hypothetical protein